MMWRRLLHPLAFITLSIPGWTQEGAGEPWTLGERGIETNFLDGDLELRLGGRIHLDAAAFAEDVTDFDDAFEFRRLRVALNGRYKDDWRYLMDYDFGGTVEGWKSLWLRYAGYEDFRITVGNQIAPFSLEELTSSNALTFVERSLANALSPAFYAGAAAQYRGENWSASGGVFGNPIENNPKKRNDGVGVNGRLTWAPIKERNHVLHFGGSAEYRNVDSDDYRIRSRPESGLANARLIDTRSIEDVNDTLLYGLEAAWMKGPFSIQAEYMATELDRDSLDVDFAGWYAQASWFVKGEGRRYSRRGYFRYPRLKRGDAVELAARISALDLEDGDITGGEEVNTTLGVNWYVNENLRVMGNWIHAEAEPNRNGVDDSVDIFQIRLQVAF